MFKGSIPALVTPFLDGEIDLQAVERLVEMHVQGGSSALLVCGTTGEAATMSAKEKKRLLVFVIEKVAGRLPVLFGSGVNTTDATIQLTYMAQEAGADGALIVTPYYNKPTQEGLFRHFETICRAVDIPVILYNVPSRTGVSLAPETVERLSRFDTIVAIKEASGSLDQVTAIRSRCNLTILSGDDSLTLPMLAVGASGVISVVANIVPRQVAEMVDSFQLGNLREAQRIHLQLFSLIKAMFLESNPGPVKMAMHAMGLIHGDLRLPLVPVSPATELKIRHILADYNLLED